MFGRRWLAFGLVGGTTILVSITLFSHLYFLIIFSEIVDFYVETRGSRSWVEKAVLPIEIGVWTESVTSRD